MNFYLADLFGSKWLDTTVSGLDYDASIFDIVVIVVFALMLVVGILAALKFMRDVRHPKE